MSLPTLKEKILDSSYAEDSNIPSFLKKTYDILESNSYPDIITWSEDGCLVIIKDTAELSEKVLPTFFKHKNFTSYVRQLNLYGFKKRKGASSEHVYYHELFQRGKKNLLSQVKRRNNDVRSGSGHSKASGSKNEDEEDSEDDSHWDSRRKHKMVKNQREGTRMSTRQEASLEKANLSLTHLQTEMSNRIENLETKFKKFSDQSRMLVDIIQSRESELEGLIKSAVKTRTNSDDVIVNFTKDQASEGDKLLAAKLLDSLKTSDSTAGNQIAIPRVQNTNSRNKEDQNKGCEEKLKECQKSPKRKRVEEDLPRG